MHSKADTEPVDDSTVWYHKWKNKHK